MRTRIDYILRIVLIKPAHSKNYGGTSRVSPRNGLGRTPILCVSRIVAAYLPFILAVAGVSLRLAAEPVPSSAGAVLSTLRTAKAAHQMALQEAARGHAVRLRGVVTYYDPYIDPRRPAFFVTDASGTIFVALAHTPPAGFHAGDLVEVKGVSGAGDFAPIVDRAQARRIGTSHLPEHAAKVTMMDMLTGAIDGQWVEMEGVVHAARQEGKNVFLDIATPYGMITAISMIEPNVNYTHLIDARIRLRGNAAPTFNHEGQMTGSHMLFPSIHTVGILQPAPDAPFDIPVSSVGNLMRFTPGSRFDHRLHIRGKVVLDWPGRMLCVQDGPKGLCAETEQADPVAVGSSVDIIGFPVLGQFNPTLVNALYRAAPDTATHPQPLSPAPLVSTEEIFSGKHDSQLVTVEGTLLDKTRAGDDPTLILASGNRIFSAILPLKGTGGKHPNLEVGSLITVTGVCSMQAYGNGKVDGSGFPIAKGFRILQRSPDDIAVIRKPSWWNARHALQVLAVALAITVLTLFRVVILSKRVHAQSAVIGAQLREAVVLKEEAENARKLAEFQATHDGLTGLRCRTSILDLLRRELQLAARSGTPTGVILFDLDHFKRVNDAHGHLVGDEVLRETARRVLRAMRSTDLIGRYGGEEFVVVLPNCDREQAYLCAERIRREIGAHPILFEDVAVPVTASVGTAVAIARVHGDQDVLAAADLALYHAKRNGRNCCAYLPLDAEGAHKPVLIHKDLVENTATLVSKS